MALRFVLLAVVFGAMACRRAETGDSARRKAPLVEDRTIGWYPEERRRADQTSLGPVDPQVLVRELGDGPPETFNIRIEPEDTLDLFAQWTGRPLDVLLQWNPEVRTKGLVPGEWFRVVLTPGEFDRLNGTRKAYIAQARATREMGLEVQEVVTHTVAEGETLKDLLERYPTSLDLLEKLNPKLRLTGIRPGQVLRIPLVSKDSPALPGPKPPAPPPVPVPPSDPKPQTVQPVAPSRGGSPKAQVAQGIRRDSPAETVYVVQPGDTAWVIARHRFGVGLQDLAEANPGVDLERLRPGMRLVIPKKP